MLQHLSYPCTNNGFGCEVMLKQHEKELHELTCPKRPCSCPCNISSCDWTGKPADVINHLVQNHQMVSYFDGPKCQANIKMTNIFENYDEDVCWFVVIQKTIFKVLQKKRKILFEVQSLTTDFRSDFMFKMTSKSGNEIIMKGASKDIHSSIKDSIQKSDCFELNAEYLLKNYVNQNTLNIDFELI